MSDDFEQPTVACPACRKTYADFDGFGVVFCDPLDGGCGYCRHVAKSGDGAGNWRCDFCGKLTPGAPVLAPTTPSRGEST